MHAGVSAPAAGPTPDLCVQGVNRFWRWTMGAETAAPHANRPPWAACRDRDAAESTAEPGTEWALSLLSTHAAGRSTLESGRAGELRSAFIQLPHQTRHSPGRSGLGAPAAHGSVPMNGSCPRCCSGCCYFYYYGRFWRELSSGRRGGNRGRQAGQPGAGVGVEARDGGWELQGRAGGGSAERRGGPA